MDLKKTTNYSEYEGTDKIDVTVESYDLPFYCYEKKTSRDPNGKIKVEKRLDKKPVEDMFRDILIVSTAAGAINLVTNGCSHLIYAFKKKKK